MGARWRNDGPGNLRRKAAADPTPSGPALDRGRAVAIAVLLPLVSLLGGLWGSGLAGPPPTELDVAPEVLTRLQTLAGGLHREIVLCLQGRVRGTVATVEEFTMPLPRLSTPTRSSFERCPRGTLASWHNHPRGKSDSRQATIRPGGDRFGTAESAAAAVNRRARAGKSDSRAASLCQLSSMDIETARRLRHPFVVVSVDARTWCWWSLAEVDRFAREAIAPAPPSPRRIAHASPRAAWAVPVASEPPRP